MTSEGTTRGKPILYWVALAAMIAGFIAAALS